MSQCSQREARPSSLARLTPWVESRFGPRSEPGQVSEVVRKQSGMVIDRDLSLEVARSNTTNSWGPLPKIL